MSADWGSVARVLGHHDVAVVLLRDGVVRWANDRAREAVEPAPGEASESDEALDERLRRQLVVEAALDDLEVGDELTVTVELATNRVLLRREGTATGVEDDVGPAVLVTFPVHVTAGTDPAHLARLETMLESTSDIIAVLDGSGRVRYANGAGRRLTGLAGRDVNGASIAELVHPDDVDGAVEFFLRAVAGEDVGVFEARLRFADGTYRPVEAEVTAEVLVDDVPGHVVTVRDISERVARQAEQQAARRLLEALVENLDDVLVVLGADLGVLWASPGIERLVDAPAYTNVGENAFNDMHPDDVPGVFEVLETVMEEPGKRGRAEFRLKHQRRGWRWVEAAVVNRLEDPAIAGLVCTLRDITEHRDGDAELRRLHEQDRKEVVRLQEADRLKDLFLATISHELRTPLSSVRGFSAVLERQYDELDEATRTDMLGRIHANAREMERMIDQLLELSRLQAGRVDLRFERVALDGAVAGLVEQLSPQLDEHEVVTRLHGLAVRADRRALDYVLRNLLTNAARYSAPGTRIEIEAEGLDEQVVIRVRDEGVGIAPEDQGRVFQSFYQADTGSTGRRGTGIGLNIARRYAQLLSGRLGVESELGVGSTFSVTLPAAP